MPHALGLRRLDAHLSRRTSRIFGIGARQALAYDGIGGPQGRDGGKFQRGTLNSGLTMSADESESQWCQSYSCCLRSNEVKETVLCEGSMLFFCFRHLDQLDLDSWATCLEQLDQQSEKVGELEEPLHGSQGCLAPDTARPPQEVYLHFK